MVLITGEDADYAAALARAGIAFDVAAPWLITKTRSMATSGWKLHISATPWSAPIALNRILPALRENLVPFKVAQSVEVLNRLNSAEYGDTQVGKFCTIYPADEESCESLVRDLINATVGLHGPVVPTDRHVGNLVYVRYGAFNPVIVTDRLGNEHQLIQDDECALIEDIRTIPFSVPKGVATPRWLEREETSSTSRDLVSSYRLVRPLKQKPTGSVYEAIDIRSQESISRVLVKQARAFTYTDIHGRDRRDRLRNEWNALRMLANLAEVPRAVDLIDADNSRYLVTTFVRGEKLISWVYRRCKATSWSEQDLQTRIGLLDLSREICEIATRIISAGVVHRDITPNNVLVDARNTVHIVDFELAYYIGDTTAPFRLGTEGYMSPRQQRGEPPCALDDVYGVASTIAAALGSGVDPRRLIGIDPADAGRRMELWFGSRLPSSLSDALAACWHASPEDNPEMLLRALRDELTQAKSIRCAASPSRGGVTLWAAVAGQAVRGLTKSVALDEVTGLPLSIQEPDRPTQRIELRPDCHRGLAGYLYVLARAKMAGFLDSHGEAASLSTIKWLLEVVGRSNQTSALPGLFFGRAGVAVALSECVRAGLLRDDLRLRSLIHHLLIGPIDWPDLTHGAAGQGLACHMVIHTEDATVKAFERACAEYLIRTQNADGGWQIPSGVDGLSGDMLYGLAHGAAGPAYFLREHAVRSGDSRALRAADRAVEFIWGVRRPARSGAVTFPYSANDSEPWYTWCHGAPGVALMLLRSYALTPDDSIAERARLTVGSLGESPRCDNLSHCHGLAGHGELFLQAARTLKDPEYAVAAERIAQVLVGVGTPATSTLVWPTEDHEIPTADLMVGGGGVCHFLLRLASPNIDLSLPLLPG